MEEEFLKSINQYQGIIIKVCRMYCDDNEDAEDLFQDILFQLWKSWPTFNSDSKVSTWMYRIGLNTAITRLRKNKQRPLFQSLTLAQHSIPNDSSQRLDILFDEELQNAIASLNKMDKGIVMLYLDEKSYKEIAEIMGLTESNVGVKINRIKEKLRKTINRR
ncbi:RNA polymerase sigma factor [Albibacterium bauzanense]|uniref:RNA polymerase sigma-70 factor (ECF subfamily) n=1 Tax=Albibacterium bauzanense TaxID=653929 RepID=A0A4R1M1M3_9SPHI|nr:sigma-70 family RNA polymerase sigma factor [Albibacterium bauzanense]TCK85575.1 RNA polymerase sigma-70 factor (ECF subfamily) [Albibacterium bauzanense]